MHGHDAGAAESREEHAVASTVMELAAAWLLVGVPLAWGVWQVVVKSLDLFRR